MLHLDFVELIKYTNIQILRSWNKCINSLLRSCLLKCALLVCGKAAAGESDHGAVRPSEALPNPRSERRPAASAGLPPRQ